MAKNNAIGANSQDDESAIDEKIADAIYYIEGDPKTYIGQTLRKVETRFTEHFLWPFYIGGHKSNAWEAIKSKPFYNLNIKIAEGPMYELSSQQYDDFLSLFSPAAGRLGTDDPKATANDIRTDIKIEGKNTTVGNVIDIAEIIHIASAEGQGKDLSNSDMGGQQMAWYINGTQTWAFRKSTSPEEAYSLISRAREIKLSELQSIVDNVCKAVFENDTTIFDKINNIQLVTDNNKIKSNNQIKQEIQKIISESSLFKLKKE